MIFLLVIIYYKLLNYALAKARIIPTSPFAISLSIDLEKDRMEIDYSLYQLLVVYHAARELNRIKPDVVVWLTALQSQRDMVLPSADDILKENVSKELHVFLKALPGLHFMDGLYICSEFSDDDPTARYGKFGKAVMIKLKAWKLSMYDRVLLYDLDQIPIKPAGFDRIFGVSGVQDENEKKMLGDQKLVGFIGLGPVHAANILLRPSHLTYSKICEVIQNGFGGYDEGWEHRGKFQSPFCDYEKLQIVHQVHGNGSNVAGGEPGTDWLVSKFLNDNPADPGDLFDWKFHGAQWDQGLLTYLFAVKGDNRPKVWLTSFSTNRSFTLNPKGDPACESHPYLDIFEASLHFGGRRKMERMGTYIPWIDRAMVMSKEFNILRFAVLRRYHEKWIQLIKEHCCKSQKLTCFHFRDVCDCECG